METVTNAYPIVLIFFSFFSFLSVTMSKSVSLSFQVKEHSEIESLIGDLGEAYRSRDPLYQTFDALHFQMMKESKYVSLRSGKLFVKSDIDREQICGKTTQCCCLNLIVSLNQLKTQTFYFEIKITIEDINDHVPTWAESRILLNIPEHTKIGSKYRLPLAKDLDSSLENSISKYTLRYINRLHIKMFSIEYNSVSNKMSLSQLLLRVDSDIDREKIEKIEMLLIAEDAGSPPLTGTTSLIITISDINDNTPYFDKQPSVVNVKENNQIDQFLCQIIARDSDVTDADRLSYSFGYSMSSEEKSKFFIDSRTGKIFTKKVMDYDQNQNVFYLPIQVTDGSNIAEMTLTVNIQNENDNAPIITILPYVNSSNNVLFVDENIEHEKIIATLTAEDIDNHTTVIQCSCTTPGFRLTRIESETISITKYTILLTKPLDRETNEFLQATIRCQDDGYPQQMSRKLLQIRVMDKNDCNPRFSSSITTVYIDEGLPIETFVTKLNATDCDVGLNAQLLFKTDHLYFTIDENTGVIKTNAVFDREKTREHKLEVTVYDRKNLVELDPTERVLSSITTVHVLIKDVNDCAPVFKKVFYELSIPEGSPSRMYVGSVFAEDADVDVINHQISYAMLIKPYEKKSHIAKIYFSVSSDGRIYTTKEILDREMYDMHSFSIEAWDSGPVTHRVSVDVVVKIEDINDNYPQWIHSSDVGLTINVTRDETVGRLITVLRATDSDSGANASLKYDIIQGNEFELFRLSQKSGSLYLMKQPSSSSPEVARLTVRVSDSGPFPLSNITTVKIFFLPEISRSFSDNRFFEKDLVVMICMITVTLIVSGILVVAIVLLKCKHCSRRPEVKYEPNDYRQGHPDGQSSPTASDMFSSAVKLSPDVPLYHNQLYHPNRLIYEAPSGVMNFQSIRKPDNLPLYYTLKPKRSLSEEVTEFPANFIKTPFYEYQQRYALTQDFIPIPPLSPESLSMHYFKHSNTIPTPTSTAPALNISAGNMQLNPNLETPNSVHCDTKINSATVKWSDTIDDKRVYERICGPDHAEIHCNHSLMTKDQISSFV